MFEPFALAIDAFAKRLATLVFHNRYAQHPAHRWLRGVITETTRRLVTSPAPEHDPSGST